MITKKIIELVDKGIIRTDEDAMKDMPRDSFLLINGVLCYYPNFKTVDSEVQHDEYFDEYVVFLEESCEFSLIPWNANAVILNGVDRNFINKLKEDEPQKASPPVKNKSPLFL